MSILGNRIAALLVAGAAAFAMPAQAQQETQAERDAREGGIIVSHPEMGERCVSLGGRGQDASLEMRSCDGSRNQRFSYDAKAESLKTADGDCLEVFGPRTAERVRAAQCNDADEQHWGIERKREGYVQIIGPNDLCIDIAGGSKQEGAAILAWGCHDGTNQLWALRRR